MGAESHLGVHENSLIDRWIFASFDAVRLLTRKEEEESETARITTIRRRIPTMNITRSAQKRSIESIEASYRRLVTIMVVFPEAKSLRHEGLKIE